MDDGAAIVGDLVDLSTPEYAWLGDDRWPRDIVDTPRYPAMDVARTQQEMSEVGRLRYELFIGRDGKRYVHADHEARMFLEPIDRVSLNFIARMRGKCAVTVRATWASDAIVDPHLEQVVAHADLDLEALDRTIVNSRMVAQPSTSARSLIQPLFQCMFMVALRADARFCLAATRSALIPLFERFGFHQLARPRPYFDEVAGWMSILVLDLHDRERLVRADSPYLPIYDEFHSRNRSRNYS